LPTPLAVKVVSGLASSGERACVCANLGDHAHNEALLLDAVRLYCVCILKNLAYSTGSAAVAASVSHGIVPGSERTRVDELLLGHLPALLCLDLGLEFANLLVVLAKACDESVWWRVCVPFPMARPR
jgi:hypothetical protein